MQNGFVYTTMTSPLGELKLVASDLGLTAVLWENDDPNRVRRSAPHRDDAHPILLNAKQQLREYFEAKRTTFDLKLDFHGTDFQKAVWHELLKIPYGTTRSYGEIAKEINRPNASRAVGAANGKNPISIIAACHRVIGTSGALTGFAGGLEAKRFLLDLESMANH